MGVDELELGDAAVDGDSVLAFKSFSGRAGLIVGVTKPK
jgi:hypothetical protein